VICTSSFIPHPPPGPRPLTYNPSLTAQPQCANARPSHAS
jgi:hypothetical protein